MITTTLGNLVESVPCLNKLYEELDKTLPKYKLALIIKDIQEYHKIYVQKQLDLQLKYALKNDDETIKLVQISKMQMMVTLILDLSEHQVFIV